MGERERVLGGEKVGREGCVLERGRECVIERDVGWRKRDGGWGRAKGVERASQSHRVIVIKC